MEIQASTPEQAKAKIIDWLRARAIEESIDARKAVHKAIAARHNHRSAAYANAATQIESMTIKSLPKPNKCPNCGKEML